MTGGWFAQLERVRRWHARLATAADPDDRRDYLYAFFENAFHLRDWLRDTGAAGASDLDALFAGSVEMRLCRDLANSHKHHSLHSPSQPTPPSEAREYTPGSGNFDADTSLVVISEWSKRDLFELADAIMSQWEQFILSSVPSAQSLT